MRETLLSIIVPVYNVEKYIGRCLDSILNQTFYDYELICVDDGSTDRSALILKEYQNRDNRIRIIYKENKGLVSARKTGVEQAKGSYVTYVDPDDWIEEEMYADMIKVAIEEDVDIITSGCIRDYGSHEVIDHENIKKGIYEGERLINLIKKRMIATDSFFDSNISIHIWNKLYKRELLLEHQRLVDDSIRTGEDAACVYPCILAAEKIAVTGKDYYHYCMRNDSIMGVKKQEDILGYDALSDRLYKNAEKYKGMINNISCQFYLLMTYLKLLKNIEKIVSYDGKILYPFGEIDKSDRVVIYGAGRFGSELCNLLKEKNCVNIVAWVDKNKRTLIEDVNILESIGYEKVIIAALQGNVVSQIRNELLQRGISKEKILSISIDILLKEI